MKLNVSIRAATLRNRIDGYAKRASASEWRAASPAVFKAMREGPRGISDQFRSGIGYFANNTAKRWEPTKAFGSLPPPRSRTLIRTGYYRDAWMGRHAGSIERYDRGQFVMGVDETIFPQVKVFQKNGITRIPVTDRMRRFLAWAFDVYLRKRTKFIRVPGRPVGVSAEMTARAAQAVKRFILGQREGEGAGAARGRARGAA